jgi:conjugative transposon TraN protein
MKILVWLSFVLSALQLQAQVSDQIELFVCYDKTVNLIFPYAITSEDHGNNGIIVQQRKGAAHILHVKANQRNFSPTSLSVVTSDGNLYSFLVRYADDIGHVNYVVSSRDAVAQTEVAHNEALLAGECAIVQHAHSNVCKKVRDGFSILQLRGLYISPQALWIKTIFSNRGQLPFDVDFIKFFVRGKRPAKNTAVQEREIFPIYQAAPKIMNGKAVAPLSFAFDPFVIQRGEQFVVQIGEASSNRLIQLRVKPKYFRRTRPLQ